jgi:hypothetical protein
MAISDWNVAGAIKLKPREGLNICRRNLTVMSGNCCPLFEIVIK